MSNEPLGTVKIGSRIQWVDTQKELRHRRLTFQIDLGCIGLNLLVLVIAAVLDGPFWLGVVSSGAVGWSASQSLRSWMELSKWKYYMYALDPNTPADSAVPGKD